ncbi:cilia- and flagella-associated protein 58-like [Centroberyx affinis]|uniref:cilia- and flagella-associated protein 58-like n=1 Tax=Centroberyx affinis TaxID=166261 RepID=UPI003A5BDA7B
MEDPGQKEGEDTFESLEKELQVVLSELVGDKSSDKFRVVYDKLTHALRKSHDSEKRLMSKCKELNAEIVSNTTKTATALKLAQEDQTTITTLKKELDKAWKMVDAAHDKEMRDKEIILNLKEEITNLTRMVEQRASMSMGKEHSANDLLKMNEELTKEKDQLQTTVETQRENLSKASATQQEIESQRESALKNNAQLQQELQVLQNEISREVRRKEKLEKEVKKLQTDMEAQTADAKALTLQAQRAKEEQQRLEQQLKEQKILNDRVTKELEQTQVRNTKLQQEGEQLSSANEQLSLESQQNANDLKLKEEEVSQMRQDIAKLTKTREATQKRFHQMEDQKADGEVQRETLKNKITGLEKELEASQKQAEAYRKNIDELVRERDILNKNMIKAAQATEEQQNLVKLQEQDKKSLNQEIHNYHQEAQKQRKIIQQLEKDRDRYINETSSLTQKVKQHLDDIEVKEMEIFEGKKKVAESEHKHKLQENLLDTVTSERNLYSKNYIEAQDDITEMKRKLKIMNDQVVQLRNEISGKDLALAKDQQENKRVVKDNEALRGELQLMKQLAEETKQHIDSQKADEQKLHKIIADADAEQIRQKKQLDQVIRERDNLGKQLLRRNDERALLYEKINIQQSILIKGDVQYNQRVADIRVLKLEIKRLRRERGNLDKTVLNAEDLRRELFHMQRELLRERTRYRAMEEQLEKPMKIHRWRTLEASDPSKYELILKIQSLQKRLISKSQEAVDNELLIQEKDKLYVEMKHILAQQPGLETAEQLQQCQWMLRERNKKMKALTAEMRMFQSNSKEYKNDNERLANELANTKKKYHSLKKQNSEQRTKAKVEQLTTLPQLSSKPHFTGGGFRINNPLQK